MEVTVTSATAVPNPDITQKVESRIWLKMEHHCMVLSSPLTQMMIGFLKENDSEKDFLQKIEIGMKVKVGNLRNESGKSMRATGISLDV